MNILWYYNSLNGILQSDHYTDACRNKVGLPLKQGSLNTGEVSFLNGEYRIIELFRRSEYVNLIPLDDPYGRVYGFLLRGNASKDFVLHMYHPIKVFGFDSFAEYRKGDPIFLAEGVKDAMAIKRLYPFALAYLGVSITNNLYDVLRAMGANIVVISDNDKQATRAARYRYRDKDVKLYRSVTKDLGVYWEDDSVRGLIESQIKNIIELNGGKRVLTRVLSNELV